MEHEDHTDEVEEPSLDMEEFTFRLRLMNLTNSIKEGFEQSSAQELRRWYVETFVLEPTNRELLNHVEPQHVRSLLQLHLDNSWISIEHAAIGERLIFEIAPDIVLRPPNLMDPDHWSNEDEVAVTMIRLFRLWETMRYDPEGENWYTAVTPGQWKRHGKGGPSNNAVEHQINKHLGTMDPETNPALYANWPINVGGFSADQVKAVFDGTMARFRKFRNASINRAKIRQILERTPIMYVDSSTFNQIRTIAPFGNGALALVDSDYRDMMGNLHRIKTGQLLPLDLEYMTMNANPLRWEDKEGRIPEAAGDGLTKTGDYVLINELEDELLLHHCPTYWSFLTHAFPDPEERSAFLRLFGAAMYGTNLKIVAALIGEPNAGKDTVLNWLNYVMPGQVATLPFSAFTPYGDDDRGFAPLRGARVATVSGEVGEGRGSKLLAEKIKTVSSGGGKIRVAEKYEKPTDIWFDGMLLLQGNSVPQIAGGDRALYQNRLVAVEFKYPFPLVARSYEAQYRAEAPWFAQVLFLNYIQYQQEGAGMKGIDPPEAWRGFAKEFADASNPHGFLEACIVPSHTPIPTSQFHAALSAMIQKYGSPYPLGANYWPKRLRTLGFPTKGPNTVRKQVAMNGKATWCYYLTLDSERSDGMFTDDNWERVLKDAGVNA